MQRVSHGQWRSLSAHLDEILELEESDRGAWLDKLSATDPEMGALLANLLAKREDDGYSGFLSGALPIPVEVMAAATLVGRSVGPYLIEAELGRGGMGSVWRARRSDGRYEGRVAIKFVHAMWLGKAGEQRFRTEGKLLGQLDHPNIARLIDAGVLDAAQPYLVLEYVEGEPIDSYCTRLNLGVEARVQLFLDVLSAVASAHSHLIVHRDIKPTNVFVTHDGKVKLLDFGIAKLLDDGAGCSTMTKSSATALTPQYAAPEQLLGNAITTATDVYALGLLLYLVLTGSHPVAGGTASSAALLHAVLTEDPARPSTVATVSLIRRRTLQGDLDTIIGKALKKSPAARYPTAEGFAADLRNYLSHDPISARRDSFAYVMGKMMRRHRLQVGAASMTLLALIVGVIGTTLQAREARHQRAAAVAQRDRAQSLLSRNEAIFDFVDMMLTDSVPADQTASLQQMLDRGAKLVDMASDRRADRKAEILRVLASYYIDLDNPQKAAPLLEQAQSLAQENGDPSLQAQIGCAYADALKLLGRTDEAVTILDRWGSATAIDGNVAAFCLQTRAIFAQNTGDAVGALHFVDSALRRVAAADAPSLKLEAALMGDRGFALHMAGDNAAADQSYTAALERFERLGLHDHKDPLRLLADWGIVAFGSGDPRRGLELYTQLLVATRRRSGTEPVAPAILANYAVGLESMGRFDEALEQYDLARIASEKTGALAAQAFSLVGEAGVLTRRGDSVRAQAHLTRATELMAGKVPETSPVQMRRVVIQARLDVALHRLGPAKASLTRLIDVLNEHGTLHPAGLHAYRLRAEIEAAEGASTAAEADARRAVVVGEKLQGGKAYSSDTGLAYLSLGRVLNQARDRRGAHEALDAAVVNLTNTIGGDHPDTQAARALLTQS